VVFFKKEREKSKIKKREKKDYFLKCFRLWITQTALIITRTPITLKRTTSNVYSLKSFHRTITKRSGLPPATAICTQIRMTKTTAKIELMALKKEKDAFILKASVVRLGLVVELLALIGPGHINSTS